MIKKILSVAVLAAGVLLGASAYAAVDINKADQAALESLKGVGPAIAERILTERKKGEFKSWADVESRVKGIKGATAGKLSDAGLTVNGMTRAVRVAEGGSARPASASGRSTADQAESSPVMKK